ncbi:VOC family protein [Streptomyces longwoodensis]|uniref:VOC family protein n=1 Tax=Streptomyces longwoodensis TaxID=68231 RepID=UPI0038098D93
MTSFPAHLDHIVLATPDLAATVAEFTRRTGVAPAPGGAHVDLGTRNHLVGLGGRAYLEIIGPDPDPDPDPDRPGPSRARPFGVDALPAARTLTWAISPPDLDAAVAAARGQGYDPGDIRAMSRRRPDGVLLEWRLTDGPPRPCDLAPFLIDWGAAAHPADSGLPVVPLLSFTATAPAPHEVRPCLTALGTDLTVSPGPWGFSFTVDTPNGPVTFG